MSFTSSENTGTCEFVYDTTAGIPAVVEEVTPSDGSFYYVREPGGELIARVEGSTGTPPVVYYHFDELGSTRLLTDDDGDVTDTYAYDAWGNTTHSGSTEQPYQYVGQLGYHTHWQDENLDLLQLGVRLYDPETGRFTQRDRLRTAVNRYPYAGSDPLVLVDPGGLQALDPTPYCDSFGGFNLNCYMEDTCAAMWAACKPDWWDHVSDGPDYYGACIITPPLFPYCPNAFSLTCDQNLEWYVGVGYGWPPGPPTCYAGYMFQCDEPSASDLCSLLTGPSLSCSAEYGLGVGCDWSLMGPGCGGNLTIGAPGWSAALTCGFRAKDLWRSIFW